MFKSQDEAETKPTDLRVSLADSDGGFSLKAHKLLQEIVTAYDDRINPKFELKTRNHSGNDELTRGGVSEAIAAVRSWDSDLAFVPYFNTISGLHEATARELVKGDLVIIAEVKMAIEHSLVTSRRAFRRVVEDKVGIDNPDVKKFNDGELSPDGAARLSSVFINWMVDLYGHPKSFEQCESTLASGGLPRREHHRLQADPIRMVLRVAELLDGAAKGGGGVFGGPPGGAIVIPMLGAKGEIALEDLYTATRGLLPIPSPFMAALAPKGSFPTLHKGGVEKNPDHLYREIVELSGPRELDPRGNATRFLLLAHANNKPILKKAMKLKAKLWGCQAEDYCSTEFDSIATKKIAFAGLLADKGKWSGFHERIKRRIGDLSLHSSAPTLLPPEILEHPGGKSMIMEGIYPHRDSVENHPDAAIKRLEARGSLIAKEAKDVGSHTKAVTSATFLGAYVAFDQLMDEHKAAEPPKIVSGGILRAVARAMLALFLALLVVAAFAWAVRDVSCKTSAELNSVPCQYKTFTDPIYREVAPTIEGWLTQFKGWTERVAVVPPEAGKSMRQTTAENSCPVGESAKPASVIASASGLACPSECSDKCVLEKREGSKTRTRCFRAPSCPAT